MKKLILFLGAAAGLISSARSQSETGVLRNYKYRYTDYRRTLSQFRGSALNSGWVTRDSSQNAPRQTSNSQRGWLGVSIYGIRNFNHEKEIRNVNWSVDCNGDYSNNRLDGKTSGINGGASYAITNYWYNFNNAFWKVSAAGYFYDYFSALKKNFNIYPYQKQVNMVNTGINFSFSRGHGRFENVSDASFASFWLRDFRKKGIVKTYTNNEIVNLAKAITRTRNTRIIDFRFNTIGQMKMLDSAFKQLGILDTADITYYTTLYDHYLYANNYQRFHGRNTEFGLRTFTGGYHQFNRERPFDTSNFNVSNFGSYNIPLLLFYRNTVNFCQSLHSQWNYSYEVNGGVINSINGNVFSKMQYLVETASPTVSLIGTIGYSYYFSTRNYLVTNLFHTESAVFGENTRNTSITDNINIDYFHWFSPNLQFAFSMALNRIKAKVNYTGTDRVSYNTSYIPNLNFSLNYALH